jgi:hypothetical protein
MILLGLMKLVYHHHHPYRMINMYQQLRFRLFLQQVIKEKMITLAAL